MGITLLAATLLTAGVAGLIACWALWPRTPNTSPLAALLSLMWSATHMAAALLTWRRSRHAGLAFLAAIALLVPLSSLIVPAGGLTLLPAYGVICLAGVLGYRYLKRTLQSAG